MPSCLSIQATDQMIAMAREKIAGCRKSARRSQRRTVDDGRSERLQLNRIRATANIPSRNSKILGQGGDTPSSTLIPPSGPVLNGVHAGCESPVENQTARRTAEADSFDGKTDHLSNHGSTSRSARSRIGREYPIPAMCGRRVLPAPRRLLRSLAPGRAGYDRYVGEIRMMACS